VALFAAGTLFALRAWPGPDRGAPWRRTARVLGAAALLGITSELLQAPLHRSPDALDVARDLLGATLALALGPSRLSGAARLFPRNVLRGAVLLVLGAALMPLAEAATDEFAARRQFPILGDFESALELDRWTGSAERALSETFVRRGHRSLRVGLGTERYSGIALTYFPEDWGSYRTLRFQIYVPDPSPLTLTCRVHDARHTEGEQVYGDRFNRRFELVPGWNAVVIPLADVRGAPRGREMDMGHIAGLGIFAVSLPEPRLFYLDDLRLER